SCARGPTARGASPGVPLPAMHVADQRAVAGTARRLMRVSMNWLIALAGLYFVVLALLWWGQEWLLFMPQRLPVDHRFDFGLDVHERMIEVPGARLSALHLQLPAPRGVVFFLHGNAGNLQSWFSDLDVWRRANFDLVMIDYRGYGKSGGRIDSEAQLH